MASITYTERNPGVIKSGIGRTPSTSNRMHTDGSTIQEVQRQRMCDYRAVCQEKVLLGLDKLPLFVSVKQKEIISAIHMDSLDYNVSWTDNNNPFLSLSIRDLKRRICLIKKRLKEKKKVIHPFGINKLRYVTLQNDSDREHFHTIFKFEKSMLMLSNFLCEKCGGVFLGIKEHCYIQQCDSCQKGHQSVTQNFSPHWIDINGIKRYGIPPELAGLRLGEQLLIQKATPYKPVVHIRYGVLGIHGHCISFPQDISSVCTSLPRVECKLVHFIRASSGKRNSDCTQYNAFIVRRDKVLGELMWLKKYNVLYRGDPSIIIDEKNLSWMEGHEEAEINGMTDIFEDDPEHDTSVDTKCDVSEIQSCHEEDLKDLKYSGATAVKSYILHGSVEEDIVSELKKTVKASRGKGVPSMNFPQIQSYPIYEYDGTPVFASAFPWLFPGGVGDFFDTHGGGGKNVCSWLESVMRFRDHRFEQDRTFCFYANDFCRRRLANEKGGIFVKRICHDCPKTFDELKECIQERNDYSFISKLQRFSGVLSGTDSFWRKKKCELREWMMFHLEKGHGPPTLFLTLSCAEYHCPDLHRLLAERLNRTNNKSDHFLAEKILQGDRPSCMKSVNLHTGLVQEFFHKRTQACLETVGKDLFYIKHYFSVFSLLQGVGKYILIC